MRLKKIGITLIKKFPPFLVLLLGLLSTLIAAVANYSSIESENAIRFNTQVKQIENRIRNRMERYENALIHTRALYLSNNHVSRNEFHDYVSGLQLLQKYPGIQGLGFTLKIRPEQLKEHTVTVRKSGFPGYNVWPKDQRSEYFSILYIEPFDWRNQRAFGFDMFTEPTRHSAMVAARDSGTTKMTRKVTLVQETQTEVQPGFLLYLPLYHSGIPVQTIEQRRKALIGFIYAPFRSYDLFDFVFFEDRETKQLLDIEIFDGIQAKEEDKLYDLGRKNRYFDPKFKPKFKSTRVVNLNGRQWTVFIASLPLFEEMASQYSPYWIALGGTLVTFLIFLIYQVNSRRLAEGQAHLKEVESLVGALREALRARDEFLSIASHELRTPLTPLKLQLQTLVRHIKKGTFSSLSEEKIAKIASISEAQIGRLGNLIDDLLDVTRISAGRLKLSPENVDPVSIVQDVVERFLPQLRTSNGKVEIHTRGKISSFFLDRLRFEQIVTNLITNAGKYAPGKKIDIFIEQREDILRLEVQDYGMGISKENQAKIFERFERVGSNENVGGLGLGLYITRQLVQAHSGSVWVESEAGMGAKFVVELPMMSKLDSDLNRTA